MAGPGDERAIGGGPDRGSPRWPAALVLLAVLSATWAWWAWQEGAWFGTVLLPGTVMVCLVAVLAAWLLPWPAQIRLSRPALVALAALIGLGGWSAASALWSPSPDIAVSDGQRVLLYALVFGLGAWVAVLLGPRVGLALVPIVFGAAVAGALAVGALLTSDAPRAVLEGGTLDYPIGYRNAEAACFGIALFCAVGLAADRGRAVWLRAVALGVATLSAECFLLAQSRGSVVALAVALVVYLAVAPRRLRALGWLALAALPAIAILPALTALYDAAREGSALDAVDEMRTAGTVTAVTALAAALVGAAAAKLESRLPWIDRDPSRTNLGMAIGLAVAALAGVAAFVVAVGDPVEWTGERIDEFRELGSPELSGSSNRFVLDASSDRYDLWRVAVDDAADDPLLGDGGGGYQDSYLREREISFQQVRDAHGVQFETVAELGIPGLALLLTALVAAAVGIGGAIRAGPPGSELAAIAAAAAAYWWVHTSIDWFWPYPSVTAPVLALLGSACAVRLRRGPAPRRVPWRALVGVGAALLALSAIPPFLAQRYVDDAYATWRSDLGHAYDQLDRAEQLNPLSDDQLLAQAAIAIAADDDARAEGTLVEAERRRPEEWVTHYLLAKLHAKSEPAEARRRIAIALELNPLDKQVRALARRLGVSVRA